MKKQTENNFPKVTFVESSGNFSFLKGKILPPVIFSGVK
jgi:hypothetical protein